MFPSTKSQTQHRAGAAANPNLLEFHLFVCIHDSGHTNHLVYSTVPFFIPKTRLTTSIDDAQILNEV